nr:hypothetical protein Iba_chr15dCG6930 [Ipomoea batatas]GMD99051.1 hypothetical protein Iba_chr15eCG0070 [Ipomoea batatas]
MKKEMVRCFRFVAGGSSVRRCFRFVDGVSSIRRCIVVIVPPARLKIEMKAEKMVKVKEDLRRCCCTKGIRGVRDLI